MYYNYASQKRCVRERDLAKIGYNFHSHVLVEICTAVENCTICKIYTTTDHSDSSKPSRLLSFSLVHEQYMQQVSLKIFRRDIVIHSSIANITTTACCRLHMQCVVSGYQVCYIVDCSFHCKWSYVSYKFPTLWVGRERRKEKRKSG